MAPPLLLLQDIHLTIGRTKLLDGAELSVGQGERLCLVGRNGSGKSTLLKIAAGFAEPDAGTRFLQPGITIRYLPQEPVLTGFATTGAYVESGLSPGDDPNRAFSLLGKLGLTGTEATETLSGGEARRAALACVLAPSPDILLLDEPTNHLDLPAIEWLENELAAMRSSLILVSHDRRFMERLGRATVWLDRGGTRRLEKGFAEYEMWRDEMLEQEERERHKLDRKIAMELDWVRYGVTARRKRNVRRMAELRALRTKRREQRRVVGQVTLAASDAGQSATCVIEAKAVCKTYGHGPVVRDFSIRILRADRIGIVGANGSGKTTLLNLLTGRLAPDSGEVKLGPNVAMTSLDQSRAVLDSGLTVASFLTGGPGDIVHVGGKARHVASYMKDFLFAPEQPRSPLHVLSGGERARLLLAKALATSSNLLVLDEPTNDLDLETLDLLEEMVADYAGTVLLVSHDRDFLDRTVTSILMAEGEGRFIEYAGGYTDMVAQRGSGVAAKEGPKPAPQRMTPARERSRSDAPRRKLSFSEKHALETLPQRIAKLHAEISELHAQLSDAGLYARDPSRFTALSEKLKQAETGLAAAEERWLTLELLREEIEGQ